MKIISIRKERILIVIYLLIIFVGLATTVRNETIPTFSMPLSKKVILIDPGHGGWDPGTISRSKVDEKDINLQISLKLQQYLEQSGAFVLMTRAEDTALSERKMNDMYNRKIIANTSDSDIIISIHQNHYHDSRIRGAQVFYFNNSDKSQLLAESIQSQLISFVDPAHPRKAESNSNYYILKQTSIPSVIVECGFMSNYTDLQNLQSEEYQSKIAWAIYMGIVEYFSQLEKNNAT